jgi:hypothetical protein
MGRWARSTSGQTFCEGAISSYWYMEPAPRYFKGLPLMFHPHTCHWLSEEEPSLVTSEQSSGRLGLLTNAHPQKVPLQAADSGQTVESSQITRPHNCNHFAWNMAISSQWCGEQSTAPAIFVSSRLGARAEWSVSRLGRYAPVPTR